MLPENVAEAIRKPGKRAVRKVVQLSRNRRRLGTFHTGLLRDRPGVPVSVTRTGRRVVQWLRGPKPTGRAWSNPR
jgi:hypothetical protein